jgi:hypothetical protein
MSWQRINKVEMKPRVMMKIKRNRDFGRDYLDKVKASEEERDVFW